MSGDGLLGDVVASVAAPGADGDRLVEKNLPPRFVTVSYVLRVAVEPSHAALVEHRRAEQVLNGLLRRPGLAELRLSHREGFFRATLDGAQKSGDWAHMHTGTITFYCPRPFLYRGNRTVSPSGGTVAIHSNHFVEPVILWTTSSAVGAAWIEVDGERLTIDTGISSGQQIRIDCARKETRVGGVLNVENIHGTYPQVRDGSTVETSPGGSIQMQYQERWI